MLCWKVFVPKPPPPVETAGFLSKKSSAVLAHVLLLAIVCTSLTNLLGYPPAIKAHWEGGFGDKYFPTETLTAVQKRVLAGALEMSSIFLMRPKRMRAMGAGLIAVMYTWGMVVNLQLNSAGPAVMLVLGSIIAWMLLANELF